MRRFPSIAIAMLAAAMAAPAVAQEGDGPVCGPGVEGRPRIALALSGGGARGSAHIGVLEVLEDLRVPVDCIAGTSAGSIIGGLYAAGLSPEEIHAVFNSIDWDKAFSDRPSRRTRSFRRKVDDATFLPNLEFGVRNGALQLPRGVVAGQNISTALKTAALRATFVREFDDLRIPFRAVTTDITTGEMVVIDEGDLARAMRASMSVPGIFAPVEVSGRLLVDGGLVRNVPVDVARAMGADVVIAVNTGTPLATRDELADIVGLSVQVINVLTQQNVDRSLAELGPQDVLLEPALDDIDATEFSQTDAAVERGRRATRGVDARLQRLALSKDQYERWRATQRQGSAPPPVVDFIEIVGHERVPEALIAAKVYTRTGEPLHLPRLYGDVERIFALDDFEQVFFDLVERDGRTGVVIRVREKAWGPNYLKFGLKIADDFEGGSRFTLLGHHLLTNVNDHGAEWRVDAALGETRLIGTEFRHPLTLNDDWFVAADARYESELFELYSGEDRVADFRRQVAVAGVDLGREISTFGEVRLGWRSGHGQADRRIGPTALFPPGEHFGQLRFDVRIDQLDDPYFPTDGYYARLSGQWNRERFGAHDEWERYRFAAGGAFTFGKQTWVLEGEAGDSSGGGLPLWEQFTLGGFLSLSGLRQQQLRGDRVLAGRVITWRTAEHLPEILGGRMRIGASIEAGNTAPGGGSLDLGRLRYGGSVFAAIDTFLGPVHFAVGLAEGNQASIYFFLGKTF
jgi:NTE family protein